MKEQTNYITGKPYKGRNQVDLQVAKEKNKYKANEWLTFLQAKEKGLKLINAKGKGVSIFKGYSVVEEKDENGKIKLVSRPSGFATVFNFDLLIEKK